MATTLLCGAMKRDDGLVCWFIDSCVLLFSSNGMAQAVDFHDSGGMRVAMVNNGAPWVW